ncbi:MAG: PAS domain-containing sensor histidine kinase [Bacteroidota bacterium]
MNIFLNELFSYLDELSKLNEEDEVKHTFIQLIQKHYPNYTFHWSNSKNNTRAIKIPVQTPANFFGNIIVTTSSSTEQSLEKNDVDRIQKGGQIIAQLLEKIFIKKEKEKQKQELIEAKEKAEKNEAKSRGLLAAIPDMMFVFDKDGYITDYHAENKDDLYAKPELFLNKKVEDALPPHLAKISREKIKQVIEHKSVEEYEYEITLNNEKHIFDSRMVYLNPGKTLAIVRDITENKQAEQELRKREALLNSIINNLPFDFWARNQEGICFIQNEKSIENWGNLLGKKTEDYDSSKELINRWNKNNKKAFEGDIVTEEYSCANKHGKNLHFQNFVAPIKDKNRVIGIMGLNFDISKRKQHERELIKAKEKAEESDYLKSAFLANMSHEIRTPMNAILGFAQLIINQKLSDGEQMEYLNIIYLKTMHLLQIINNIIDLSKIEANQVKIRNQTFPVNQIFKELLEEYKTILQKNNKTNIQLKVPENCIQKEIYIHSDKTRIHQILSILLTNAVKFTEKGYIEFGFHKGKDQILFYVKDTGIGIPHDKQEVIFHRFRQAEDYSTRRYGGTGLGLSISKSLTKIMGGKIWVESKENEGSCFFFTIPLNKYPDSETENNIKNEIKTVGNENKDKSFS